jgi:ferric-dicitrate binding protein FerR (iron transport regulator)
MFRRNKFPRTVTIPLAAAALAVCLPVLSAQDLAAKVLAQTGMVSVADGRGFAALMPGSSVKPQQLIITGPDGWARFQVSDGSTFEVFQNSKVVFRETMGDWKHLINVFLGRIKVFVQHAPGVPNPNNVTSPTAVVSVRGTVFDVVVEDADGTTFVTVDEGQVAVRNITAPGNSAILNPGDSIRVLRGQPLFARQIDPGSIFRKILLAARDAVLQMPAGRPGGGGTGIPGGGTTGGAQGDKTKDGTTTGTGTPPAPTGTPPPPGGE